jgi:hypothetical protein
MCGRFIHCYAEIFLHDGFNCCNGLWCQYSMAWPGRGESVTELKPFMNFLVHSHTCCTDRHASSYWTFIRRWISMGYTPSLLKKLMMHVASGAAIFQLCTTAPSCCIPASYCHMSATLQTMSINVVNLQDNLAVFRIFIALLIFFNSLVKHVKLAVDLGPRWRFRARKSRKIK